MKKENFFFNELYKLQDESVDAIVKARNNNLFSPNWQFPYHAGSIEDKKLMEAMKYSIKDLTKTKNFMDPCAGDGFSLILASKLGYDVYGLEIENALVDIANENIDKAKKMSLTSINKDLSVIHGDMFNLSSYKPLGISFNDIDVFYLYTMESEKHKFFKQFLKQGKPDSKVILVPSLGDISKSNMLDSLNSYDSSISMIHEDIEDNVFQIYQKTRNIGADAPAGTFGR